MAKVITALRSASRLFAPLRTAAHRYATRQKTRLVVPMKRQISVLDHGHIALVDSMGGDLSIVRAARVSYDAAWRAGDDAGSDARLIRRLWKDGHTSPFEMVEVVFEVVAPIFVLRQWHRHRTQSYSEQSGRYSELENRFYLPDPELIGEQSTTNKQGRQPGGDIEARRMEVEWLRVHSEHGFREYHRLIAAGWPRELARCALPLNAYSHMFCKINLLNLFRFLTLRAAPDAQFEIRSYAEAMLELVRPIAPVAVGAWEDGRAK
jgi:thymidylate synthase (FAD)